VKYFIMFLSSTALHASLLFILCLVYLPPDLDTVDSLASLLHIFLLVYTCLFALALGAFTLMQARLLLVDITTNEQLRHRWNAKRAYVGIHTGERPSTWARLYYQLIRVTHNSHVHEWHNKDQNALLLGTFNEDKYLNEYIRVTGV
jgi:hypothetical protein